MKSARLILAAALVAGSGLLWAVVSKNHGPAKVLTRPSALKQAGVRFRLGVNDVDAAYVATQWREKQ